MATFTLPDGFTMHYQVDDFTDPWRLPETVLLLHGNFESSLAWYGWPPHPGPPFKGGKARHARLRRLHGNAQ